MKKCVKVAVTGGIGSGKTSVLAILKNLGYKIYNCDESAKKALKNRKIIKSIKKQFPFAVSGVIFPRVNKKLLADKVFADEKARKQLEMITHPFIVNDVIKKAEKEGGISFIEVPLLFEGGYQNLFDKTIVILRDKTERIKSVMERSNLTEKEVLARMNSQIEYDKKDFSNYIVIVNNGDKEQLEKDVLAVSTKINNDKKRR